jgi:hypothetical protein
VQQEQLLHKGIQTGWQRIGRKTCARPNDRQVSLQSPCHLRQPVALAVFACRADNQGVEDRLEHPEHQLGIFDSMTIQIQDLEHVDDGLLHKRVVFNDENRNLSLQ